MGKIVVTKTLPVPAEDAWKLLADFGNIAAFHPGLSGSHLLEGSQPAGLGAERRCDLKDRNHLVERVVDWRDGESYTVDIIETSMPLRRAQATLSVSPLSAETCDATMTVDMTMKYGVLGKLMEIAMAGPVMRKTMKGILDGLGTKAARQDRTLRAGSIAAPA